MFQFLLGLFGMRLVFSCQPNERGRGRMFVFMAITTICGYGFIFQVITMVAELLVSKEWPHTCLWEVVNQSSVWFHVQLLLSLLTVIVFCHESFHLPSIFSPSHGRVNKEAVVWAFGCWLRSAHDPVLLSS